LIVAFTFDILEAPVDFWLYLNDQILFTSNLSFIETDNCLTLAYGFASSNYNSIGLLNWNVAKVTNYLSCFENSSFNWEDTKCRRG
jgi:hypothetical protein